MTLVSCAIAEHGLPVEEGVVVLDDKSYDEGIKKFDMALVEFYAPWCGHCQALAPEFVKVAAALKEQGSSVALIKFDADSNPETAQKMEVQSYPTLKWYRNGHYVDYDGPRESAGIISWITKRSGPPTVAVNNQAAIDAEKIKNDVTLIYLGAENDDFKVFQNLALTNDDLGFLHSHNTDLIAAHGGERVVMLRQFDEPRVDLEGSFDATSLSKWVDTNRWEVVMEIGSEASISRAFGGKDVVFLLFADLSVANEENSAALVKEFAASAKDMHGKMMYASVDTKTEIGGNLLEHVGFKEQQVPGVVVLADGAVARWLYDGPELTQAHLNDFVERYLAGSVQRNYRSAEIPEVNNQPALNVVGKQWDELVINNEKDVLVEFYAPWCGHCKALKPKYDKLAVSMMRMKDNLVIASMDAIENEVPGVEIESFPTIILFKNGQKDKPVTYNGARTVKAMTKWLKKNVSFNWVPAVKPKLGRDQYPVDPNASTDAGAASDADL